MNLEHINKKIHEIRGQTSTIAQLKMLDYDLAELYEVETRVLKQAVKRNIERFPIDFMFELNENEIQMMVSQNVIPSKSYLGGAQPFAFTEHGVSMLSAILKSKKAISISILIMRAFTWIKKYAISHSELSEQLKSLENKYDKQFEDVFEAINYLLKKDTQEKQVKNRDNIGYKK